MMRHALLAVSLIGIAACGSPAEPNAVTLVAYASFPVSDTPLNDALTRFSVESGIEVNILIAGDTGTMLTKAALTAGNPEGDVMWGIDSTMLGRAVDSEIFESYRSPSAERVRADLASTVPDELVTPVDFGDVCVNFDREWFYAAGLAPPATLNDLIDPIYADLLVVEDPAASSPGLAFLLSTIDRIGDGWERYWQQLVDNGVLVAPDWDSAYYGAFTRAGGDRPLVVSYGSSPPYEVLFSDNPDATTSPTGVIADTCYRQVEYAGVLRGTDAPEAARRLIDFLISDEVQQLVPLDLYVFPAVDVALDPVFVRHAVIPDDPAMIDAATIDASRADWIARWSEIAG